EDTGEEKVQRHEHAEADHEGIKRERRPTDGIPRLVRKQRTDVEETLSEAGGQDGRNRWVVVVEAVDRIDQACNDKRQPEQAVAEKALWLERLLCRDLQRQLDNGVGKAFIVRPLLP